MATRWNRIGVTALVVLTLSGLWAIAKRFSEGLIVTNLTSNVAWGMWVSFYIYCIGLSAGSFLLSTLVYVFGMERMEKIGRIALLSALLALVGGLLFVWIDLGHPGRFWKIFVDFQATSVLAWESLLYVFYIVVILAELWFLMRVDLARLAEQGGPGLRRFYRTLAFGWQPAENAREREQQAHVAHRWIRALGILGIPIAIGVHGGTGAIFAVAAAKPYWFSGLFPIVFLVSALVSGCGLMLFLYGFWGRRDEDYEPVLYRLRDFLMLLIAIDALLLVNDLLVGLYGEIPDHAGVLLTIMFGDYWYVFWLGQIGLGWSLPLLVAAMPMTRTHGTWLAAAGLMVAVGIVAVRLNLVIPAYLIPPLEGLDEAFRDPRLAYEYFPSVTEWVSSIGLFALLSLGLILGWRILPVYPASGDAPSRA
jgi:molybdopterin-containing oxidoreductase family membrane subunit